jgi:hypothetical protein
MPYKPDEGVFPCPRSTSLCLIGKDKSEKAAVAIAMITLVASRVRGPFIAIFVGKGRADGHASLRLWDCRLLLDIYAQLQEIRNEVDLSKAR